MTKPKIIFDKPSVEEILSRITAFVVSESFEESYVKLLKKRWGIVEKLKEISFDKGELTEESLIKIMRSDIEAIGTITSLLGVSQEEFYREVSLLRMIDNGFDTEWKIEKIFQKINEDTSFAEKIARLFLHGREDQRLKQHIPRFALDKFDKNKLLLIPDTLVDSLLRTGLKGRYDAQKGSVVQDSITEFLRSTNVCFLHGDIKVPHIDRRMDFVIPTIKNPIVFIECGVFITTARELSEKGVLEMRIREQVEEYYPNAVLVRILDGIRWIARGGNALSNVIDASHYTLTLKDIEKLGDIARAHVPKEYFTA